MNHSDKHQFAIFNPNVWPYRPLQGAQLTLTDVDLVHRLVKVLRCKTGDRFILFDRAYHGLVEIQTITKKQVTVLVLEVNDHVQPVCNITFLLPLLKKEALEEVVYGLTEIGVRTIQLVITQKSRLALMHEKEFIRLEAILIAAAEQSKNYHIPVLLKPKKISECLNQGSSGFVFDMQGTKFHEIASEVSKLEQAILLVGPEGGLTSLELDLAAQAKFRRCQLTTTTLRAVQAATVAAALFSLAR